jgi:hypothetical protein
MSTYIHIYEHAGCEYKGTFEEGKKKGEGTFIFPNGTCIEPMYIYVYVCMYIYTLNLCIYMYIYIYIHICIMCVCVCLHVCMYVYERQHTLIFPDSMCWSLYTYAFIIHILVHVQEGKQVYTKRSAYLHTARMYVCMYTYIHTNVRMHVRMRITCYMHTYTHTHTSRMIYAHKQARIAHMHAYRGEWDDIHT